MILTIRASNCNVCNRKFSIHASTYLCLVTRNSHIPYNPCSIFHSTRFSCLTGRYRVTTLYDPSSFFIAILISHMPQNICFNLPPFAWIKVYPGMLSGEVANGNKLVQGSTVHRPYFTWIAFDIEFQGTL